MARHGGQYGLDGLNNEKHIGIQINKIDELSVVDLLQ